MVTDIKIKKRDGTIVTFNAQKIIDAINKAFIDVDGKLYETDTATSISEDITSVAINAQSKGVILSVEEVQNLVEEELMESERKDVARAYIRYRYKKEVAREKRDDFDKAIEEKLLGKNKENKNANLDETSFGGRMGEAADVVMRDYALNHIISEKSRKNHLENRVYIHDLSHYVLGDHNCLTVPFDDLLAKGFNTRQVDIRPANSVSTALQLVAVIFQLQSLCQFGGVSASHLDWTLVPYVRKSFYKHYKDGAEYLCNESWNTDLLPQGIPIDNYAVYSNTGEYLKVYKYAFDMTEKEVHQGVEALYHNLNSLQSRSGNQLPFTSVNYGTCILPEGRMITKALLDVSIAGLGRLHRTSIFPCGIFQVMSGVNKELGTPNYDLYRLALKSTALRLYPNYANVNWSGNAGFDPARPDTYFSTMGCRTANGWDINGLGQQKDGRGNICPVTIILPTLAMEAKQAFETQGNKKETINQADNCALGTRSAVDAFLVLLDKAIDDAKDALIERFEYICSQSPAAAQFMYENHTMAGYIPEKGIRSALKHGTLAIGQLGLAECLQILIGEDHTTPHGMEVAKKIEQLFKDRCAEFKETYKLNFGVYFTPAESLCYSALKAFRSKYGVIQNVSDRDYFTNSMHCPVWKKLSPFEKIDIESQLTGYSSAGCITYVELDSGMEKNIDAMETLVNYAMDHDIPYFALNIPNDTCLDCGYTGEFNNACPVCGSPHIQQLRRVTGYLTGNYKTAFNNGKIAETEDRVKHAGRLEE